MLVESAWLVYLYLKQFTGFDPILYCAHYYYKDHALVLKKHLKSTVTRVYVTQAADHMPYYYTMPTAIDQWSPMHLMMAARRLNIEKRSNLIFLLRLVSLRNQFMPKYAVDHWCRARPARHRQVAWLQCHKTALHTYLIVLWGSSSGFYYYKYPYTITQCLYDNHRDNYFQTFPRSESW